MAVSMLQSGNWILPLSMGADIPYKPPMLAWLIALVSLPAGHVTEYSSRLPSALAAILMVWGTWRFFSRNGCGRKESAITALILMTSIEVWRSASACRVDMVLTAATVGAIYSLYNWTRDGMKLMPVTATGLMTIAVLTKGPVGFIIPVMCVWLFNLTRRRDERKVWRMTWKLAAAGLMSCVIPAAWYIMAAQQGGQEFLDLIYEENIGRATGTMSYASHENGPWYNFATLASGLLPYTIGLLLAAITVRWSGAGKSIRQWWKERNQPADGRQRILVYCAVCALAIILFYTIPKSKRSVYILPMYPMMAYMVTIALQHMSRVKPALSRGFAISMGAVAIITGAAGAAGPLLPEQWLAKLPLLHEWLCRPASVILSLVAIGTGISVIRAAGKTAATNLTLSSIAAVTISYWTLSSGILPGILNGKSDKPVAEAVEAVTLPEETIYQFVDDPMLRYYTANFYLEDRIRLFDPETMPAQGVMIVSEKDLPRWRELYGDRFADSKPLWRSTRKSCDTKSPVLIIPVTRQ